MRSHFKPTIFLPQDICMPTSSVSTYCINPPLLFLDLDLPIDNSVSLERVEISDVHFFYPLSSDTSLPTSLLEKLSPAEDKSAEELSNSWQFCWAYLQKQLVNTDSNCCVPVGIILIFQTLTFIALFCLVLINSLIHKDHLLGHWETRLQHRHFLPFLKEVLRQIWSLRLPCGSLEQVKTTLWP